MRIARRSFDIGLAIPLVVLTLPIVVLLALGSAISFRAWPFFSQARVGNQGRLFWFVKVRSLPATTPSDADKYTLQTITNTRFGSFIRRTHLDELPQLWLVVTGRMSIVGPRPEMPSLAAAFDPDFATARQTVRPGCTGLWQISPAAGGLIAEGAEYDLFYLAHSSVRFDLWIIYRTVLGVLTDRPRVVTPPLWALRGTAVNFVAAPDALARVALDLDGASTRTGRERRHAGAVHPTTVQPALVGER